MKLYLKKLRNTEELEQEKRRLIREKKRMEKEGFLSLEGLSMGKGEGGVINGIGSVISNLPPGVVSMAGPVAGLLVDIVKKRFTGKKEDGTGKSVVGSILGSTLKKGGNVLGATAKELIVGYLRWKAVELSYKGVTLIVRKRKKNKEARAAKEAAEKNKVDIVTTKY